MRLLGRGVSRLRETVEWLTKERPERAAEGPNNDSEGQKGDERKFPRVRTGAIMGPPPPPPPHPRPASRRTRCSGGLGGSANNKEADKVRFGGPGSRDPLEDLKILFFRKLAEWWREMKSGGAIPQLQILPPPQEPCKHGRGLPETPRGRPWSCRLTK